MAKTLYKLGVALIVVATLIAGGLWCQVLYRTYNPPRNWGIVEPDSIFRSGQISRYAIDRVLKEHGITRVIFMSEDKADRPDVQAEIASCRKLGIERLNFPLDGRGRGNIRSYADAVAALVDGQSHGLRTLVHCHAGSQRTGGVVAVYRLLVQKKPADMILQELSAYGHDPDDNPSLIPFLNEQMPAIAQLLHDKGVISEIPNPIPKLPTSQASE